MKIIILTVLFFVIFPTFGQTIDEEIGTASFQQRCFSPDVVLCDPLDTEGPYGIGIDADTPHANGLPFDGRYRDWRWVSKNVRDGKPMASLDPDIKASGTGSLRFTIPSESGAGKSGYYQTNFTPDNSVQFGEGETFFVQWRQRFSRNMLLDEFGERRKYDVLDGLGGFKTIIINAGDNDTLQFPVSSCTRQHIVLYNYKQHGALAAYTSCGLYENVWGWLGQIKGSQQFDVQPGGESQCLKLDPATGKNRTSASEGCVLLWPDEWMTFQIKIEVGNWGQKNSKIFFWIAREGQPSELVIQRRITLYWPEHRSMKYGKVWLLPYHTAKDPTEVHPEAYTWYDELIVSRARIPDPTGGCP